MNLESGKNYTISQLFCGDNDKIMIPDLQRDYCWGDEDKELVKRRIYEATKYIPLERLYLSPQCGFASCEISNKLTEEQQWAKLKLVKEIAEEVWG